MEAIVFEHQYSDGKLLIVKISKNGAVLTDVHKTAEGKTVHEVYRMSVEEVSSAILDYCEFGYVTRR